MKIKASLRAFTRIGLLVVVAIIAILASILMPALSAAKSMALQTCAKTRPPILTESIPPFTATDNGCLSRVFRLGKVHA